jgi:diguanylate cyclase (GGDEF)-like protein
MPDLSGNEGKLKRIRDFMLETVFVKQTPLSRETVRLMGISEKFTELDQEDDFIFRDEEELIPYTGTLLPKEDLESSANSWKILIVDDEPSVHRATELALKNFTFEGKPVSFISAYSGKEGIEFITTQHPDTAIILLDVVMESNDAGLKVVQYIREELHNHRVRIILRTGNPGDAPEESVILNYDINDYKLKVELTRQRLITSAISALRSFRDIATIEQQKQDLEVAVKHLKEAQEKLKAYSYTLEIEVSKRTAELEQSNKELQRLALLDGLTMIPNRRHFDAYLEEQWMLLSQLQQPLSLIVLDVDCFKLYNDHYGHLAGDDCLKQVAQAIGRALQRPTDLVARFGGEEFAVVLPLTTTQGAQRVARSVAQEIDRLQLSHAYSLVGDRITLSQGISTMIPSAQFSLNTLIATADIALYQAKQKGRNQTFVYGS